MVMHVSRAMSRRMMSMRGDDFSDGVCVPGSFGFVQKLLDFRDMISIGKQCLLITGALSERSAHWFIHWKQFLAISRRQPHTGTFKAFVCGFE